VRHSETDRQMPSPESRSLPIAVRVYPDLNDEKRDFIKSQREWKSPDAMFVFDTETRTDRTQRLTFGSYRFIVAGRLVKENLFRGDDLPAKDLRILGHYVTTPRAVAPDESGHDVSLLTRHKFVEKLFRAAYKGRCLLVAFNFPFDTSRVARSFTNARKRFARGFSLDLWSYQKDGGERRHPFRPSICIKHIDSKRALKGFTGRRTPDEVDLIPEGSTAGKPEEGYIFRGHFLDLRTLAFALTDRGYTLEQACSDFGVEHGKQTVKQHGIVTNKYIDYNRRDVLATSELAVKLLEEYDKHPINLQPTKAYSPASIGKAYLQAMGIPPILERQPDFPKRYLGYAQSAFFGGRTSAHIRKVSVPVVYTDFLSMYPTVNSLMDLWSFVTAREIGIVEHCQAEIETFLRQVTASHASATTSFEVVEVKAGSVSTVTVRLRPLVAPVAASTPKVAPDFDLESSSVQARAGSVSGANTGWWMGRKWTWLAASSTVLLAVGSANSAPIAIWLQ